MKSISVALLETNAQTDVSDELPRLVGQYPDTTEIKVGQVALDPTSKADMAQLPNYLGQPLTIMVTGKHEAEVVSRVHQKLVDHHFCY